VECDNADGRRQDERAGARAGRQAREVCCHAYAITSQRSQEKLVRPQPLLHGHDHKRDHQLSSERPIAARRQPNQPRRRQQHHDLAPARRLIAFVHNHHSRFAPSRGLARSVSKAGPAPELQANGVRNRTFSRVSCALAARRGSEDGPCVSRRANTAAADHLGAPHRPTAPAPVSS
jgi:hypothetical protein